MLKGFDKDWIYCGRNQTAAYTNVPDGHYSFLVKATGNKGQWMESFSSLNIHVLSPYWKSWWFLSLVILLVVSSVFWLYKVSKKRRQKKNIEKTIDYFA